MFGWCGKSLIPSLNSSDMVIVVHGFVLTLTSQPALGISSMLVPGGRLKKRAVSLAWKRGIYPGDYII